jgi:hypothetical protein
MWLQQIILQRMHSHQCLHALHRKLLYHAPRTIYKANQSRAAKENEETNIHMPRLPSRPWSEQLRQHYWTAHGRLQFGSNF